MLQVNYAHLPASLRCRRGQPSPRIRAPRKDVGRSPGRGPPALGRPPPVNQEENRRWGCLIYSHPSTSVLNTRARKGDTAWFQHGLGRVSERPCPWLPLCTEQPTSTPGLPYGKQCRGQSLPLLSFPRPPLPSPPHLPYLDLGLMLRVCWGPGESGPRHRGQKWISCFRPQAGFCLGSSEHGETPIPRTVRPTAHSAPRRGPWREARRGPGWRGVGLAVKSLSGGWHQYSTIMSPPRRGPGPPPAQACAAPSPSPESTAAPGSRHGQCTGEARRDSAVGMRRQGRRLPGGGALRKPPLLTTSDKP